MKFLCTKRVPHIQEEFVFTVGLIYDLNPQPEKLVIERRYRYRRKKSFPIKHNFYWAGGLKTFAQHFKPIPPEKKHE